MDLKTENTDGTSGLLAAIASASKISVVAEGDDPMVYKTKQITFQMPPIVKDRYKLTLAISLLNNCK